ADFKRWRRPKKLKGTNVVHLSKPRAGDSPTDYLTAGKFVAAMTPAPAMVMTTLFLTGMRPIELFVLTADDVDVEGRWIVIPKSKPGDARGVPMHEFLVPVLTNLKERGGILFRSVRGKPYPLKDDGGGQMKTAIN